MATRGRWGADGPGSLTASLRHLSMISKIFEDGGSSGGWGRPPTSKGWMCVQPDCNYALAKWHNKHDKMWCGGCQRPKAEAMNPKARSPNLDKDKANGVVTKPADKQLHKREVRARKREARAAAKAATSGSATAPPATPPLTKAEEASIGNKNNNDKVQKEATKLKKLQLPEEVTAQATLLTNLVETLAKNLNKESTPAPPDPRTPEEILLKIIGGKGPIANTDKKDQMAKDIAGMKAGLAAMSSCGETAGDAIAQLKAQIEASEAALAKISKNPHSMDFEYKAILEAKSAFELTIQARKDKEAKGISKATERKAERTKLFQDARDLIKLIEETTVALDNENCVNHKARAVSASETDNKVLELIDKRLSNFKPPDQAALSTGTASPQALPPGQIVVQQPQNLQDLEAANKLIEQLQKQVAAAKPKMLGKHMLTFDDILEADMPEVKIPEKEHLPAVARLHATLNTWTKTCIMTPFDWATIDGILGDKLQALTVAKELMGGTWKKWYPNGDPDLGDAVPYQAGQILFHALNEIKNEFETIEGRKQAAMDGIQLLKESAKRLRAA